MTKSSQWFLRELHNFSSPWKGEQSTNMASPPRLYKHGMALITDAYFGVTSEAACLLFVSVLCFPVWAPPSLRESTCKEYYSVLKGLSSQGVALSLLYASGSKLIAARGTKWLYSFMLDIKHRQFLYCLTAKLLGKWLKHLRWLTSLKNKTSCWEKSFFFLNSLLNLVLVSFPDFLEASLSAFDVFLCEDQAYAL